MDGGWRLIVTALSAQILHRPLPAPTRKHAQSSNTVYSCATDPTSIKSLLTDYPLTSVEYFVLTFAQETINNKASSPEASTRITIASPLSKDLSRAVLSQLSILITKLNKDNCIQVIRQIHSILDKHPNQFPTFIRRLVTQITAEIIEQENASSSESYATNVLQHELNYLTLVKLDKVSYIPQALLLPESQFLLFSLEKFLSFFKLTDFQCLLICLSIEQFIFKNKLNDKYASLLKELPHAYTKYSSGVVEWLELVVDLATNSPVRDNLSVFLTLFLDSEVFSLPQRFVVLSHISSALKLLIAGKTEKNPNPEADYATDSLTFPFQTKSEKINKVINNFIDKVRKMNLQHLILEFCQTKSNPERILSDLLSIQSTDKLQDAIRVLLAETLFPGSQSKQINQDASADVSTNSLLTSNNLPEATARGSKMSQVIIKIKDKINWEKLFSDMLSTYDQNLHRMTTISLSQFLGSIQADNLIDKFLAEVCKCSDISLLSQVFVQLNSLDPNAGGFNLYEANLTPILLTEVNSRHLLLYYKYIVMLEIKTVSRLSFTKTNDNMVSQIFNKDLRAAPEYMILACLHLLHDNPSAGENEIIVNIMQNFFISLLDVNSPYLSAIFTLFEEYDSVEFGKLLLKYLELKRSPDSVHKIANLTASFKNDGVIRSILDNCDDFQKGFTIAVTFSQYGWKHFKDYINKQVNANPNVVLPTILDYLTTQAKLEYESSQQGKRVLKSLNLETVYFLMTTLSSDMLPKELFEKSRNLQTLCLQAYPRLINFGQGHDSAILMNSVTNSFSVDVEKEMKMYYQQMYTKDIEIKDIVHMLQRLKNSDSPHDQDVFACMIHSLLDEYRFFPEYPVDALATTSVLFGNTIVYKLVEGPALSIALRYVLESAREPVQSKMFKFAVQALYSFMKRLPEFPKFCSMLCEIQALKSHSELYEVCQNIATGKVVATPEADASAETSNAKNNVMEEEPELFSKYYSVSIPEITQNVVTQEVPPNEVSDRILFMVNNVSEGNLDSRTIEMKEMLKPNHYKWFAKYLVNQRAKLELNNQSLYSAFVKKIGSRDLYSHVAIVTIRSIVLLLNLTYKDSTQDSRDLSPTEKTHLKNLGSWLGRIFLSNDHPILRKDINFKYLLLEAYHQRSLEYILPLICKMLDQAKLSTVFKSPNPWLLGILQVLKELYEIGELKLNLKFEIEVLCNELSVKLEEIEAAQFIRSKSLASVYEQFDAQKIVTNMAKMALNEKRGIPTIAPSAELSMNNALLQQQQLTALHQIQQLQQQRLLGRAGIQNSPAVNNFTPLAQQAALLNAQQQQQQHLLPQQQQQQHLQQQQQQQQQQQTPQAFENLEGNTIFVTHPALKRILQLSITKAVKDLLPPLVHRTNTVCLVTTKALIQKDFAFEVDDFKIRKAYINAIRHFSESLIVASSAELVRETIQSNVQQYLQTYMNSLNTPVDPTFIEQIPVAVNDNIQLALSIIQKAAVEKAVHDLDDAMLPAIALRRQFKLTSPNQVFCDTQNASKYAMTLPDPLSIKPGGVTDEQFKVYEDFGKASAEDSSDGSANTDALSPDAKHKLLQQQLLARQQQAQQAQQLAQQQQARQQQVHQQAQQQQQTQGLPQAQNQIPPQGHPQQALPQQMNKVQPQVPIAILEQTITFVNQHLEVIIRTIDGLEDKNVKLTSGTTETDTLTTLLTESVQALTRVGHQDLFMKYTQIAINTLFNVADPSPIFIDTFLFLIANLCDASTVVVRYVNTWLFNSADERKLNLKVFAAIISEGFMSLSDLSYSLSKHIELTKNTAFINFTCDLIKEFVFGENPCALRSDFITVISTFENGDESIKGNEKVKELFTTLESNETDAIVRLKDGLIKTGDVKEYMAYMFSEWVKLYKLSNDSKYQIAFISQLVDSGILTNPELFTHFFTVALEMSVVSFVKENDNFKKFTVETDTAIDSLAKLIVVLLFVQDDDSQGHETRLSNLNNIFSTFVMTFANDHETNKGNFNERPYFRFFSTLFYDISLLKENSYMPYADDGNDVTRYDELYIGAYELLADTLLCLQPAAFPGFTYAWICLISHHVFMPTMIELDAEDNACCEKYCALLVALLRFESGYVKGNDVPESISVIHKGTLRIFTVLLHDYPEFLAQWFNPLINATSMTFIQLRNIILSAVPYGMVVPDPFQQGLKVDRLPEISVPPIVSSDPSQLLLKKNIKKTVDNYLRIPSNSLLRQILLVLELNEAVDEGGIGFTKVKYNIELINSLVLYAGISYVEERSKNSLNFNSKSSQVSLLTSLMQEGDVELQYLILQAIANNLRYPNSHTHWYSCVVLHFFGSKSLWGDKRCDIQQLITRVLLERIVSSKPHPWGLLVTFIELLKNKDYEFSTLPFTKLSPEIEKVLGTLIEHTRTASSSTIAPAVIG